MGVNGLNFGFPVGLSNITIVPISIRPFPFFFRLMSNAFSDFGLVGRKKKKKTKIKLENCLELGGPVPQHNISGYRVSF